ncbi:ABC transporter ATP-binding protein [Candidatus Chlorohelix sp.]|uniref:ABC transporter ATP-binding protein n=1 Tax=Candidatus Chlorohelix sp. TaxID=3139201 RepID=UPI00305F9BCE
MTTSLTPSKTVTGTDRHGRAIRTENLTKRYGRNRGVTELNLDIAEGEFFGFLGPNGAGKTTTIRLLMNEIHPTSGRANVFGLDCMSDSVKIKRLTGYLPGEFMLYPGMTGAQTLKYLSSLRGGVDWKHIAGLAERLQLDLSKKFREYSHGNKQKVGIIQAIMHKPRLLILDEPSNGLDPLNQHELFNLLRELRNEGATVFLSSHIMSEVESTCDRVALIREGKMVKMGSIGDLADLKCHYLEISFKGKAQTDFLRSLEGVDQLEIGETAEGDTVRCIVSQEILGSVVKHFAQYEILDFVSHEPSLENIFMDFYGNGKSATLPEGR